MPLGSLLNNALSSLSSLRLRRLPSIRESLRTFSSSSSLRSQTKNRPSSYYPNSVDEQPMQPIILRDPDATNKLLEAILESQNGKRALSRLARTCRAMRDPALNVLWRDLDSLIPILWQFPGHLLKKARKPGMGFVKLPTEDDWKPVFKYSDRVHQLTYNENANNVTASIFTVLKECRPRTHILPHLAELNWKVETSEGLERAALFLNPELRGISLEIGTRLPQLHSFLTDMSSRTKLTSFSFISPTSLPDAFTELLLRQKTLEKVVLVAPGALAPDVGRWAAALPQLKHLRMDLTGRAVIAVEGFFDEVVPGTGASTPASGASTDSGVFSDDELDFSLVRKAARRRASDSRSKGPFAPLRKLHLTGDVANIAAFVRHLTCPLTQLELVIEDPPDRADWKDLSIMICEKFGDSLQSLKVTATGSSRFMDLVRSTSRAEPASGRLTMQHLKKLPHLTRLDIDLPESVVFTNTDIKCIAKASPNLEILKLCPLARFPPATGPPKISLDSVAYLMRNCRNLHTLAAVIDAKGGGAEILKSRESSSKSLLRLHVGHSWIDDSLQVSILLSHLAPRLETLKWFQEKNRPGFIEANARNWQRAAELLPHLQNIRLLEQRFSAQVKQPVRREMAEKSVEAIVRTAERAIHAVPTMRNRAAQFSPTLVSQMVQAKPMYESISIDATPPTVEAAIEAIVAHVDQEIDAVPPPTIDAGVSSVTKSVQALLTPFTFRQVPSRRPYPTLLILPSILGLLSFAYRLFIFYPLSLPSRILHMASSRIQMRTVEAAKSTTEMPSNTPSPEPTTDIPLDTLQVRQ